MGAKKNQKGDSGEQKKSDGGKKEGGGDGNISVVLKADLHCEGCIFKIIKTIRSCDGVEEVKVDGTTNKVTVTGKVDPAVLRKKVEAKTHKQVVIVSPQPSNKGGEKAKDGGDGGEKQKKKDNKKEEGSKESKGENEKKAKEKEAPVTTAVFKMNLHCEGCIEKIRKIVSKTKGFHEMKLEKQKELLTVTGSMDMKALAENLKKHLKRDVVIVPPKKEGGEKKEKGGDGGGNEKGKGGKKEGGGEGGGGGQKNAEELNEMQVQVRYPYQGPYPYTYLPPGYVQDPMYYNYPHAPQMFSDENPNACSVM